MLISVLIEAKGRKLGIIGLVLMLLSIEAATLANTESYPNLET